MTTTATLDVTKIDSAQEQKEVTANEAFDAFDAGLGQFTKALSDADYTLSSVTVPKEWNYGILYFTGTLTANRNIIVPTNKKTYVLINGTTGGYSLTLKTSAGTGIAAASSTPKILRCDGTNVVDLFTVPSLSTITPNAQTGTTYTYVNGDNSKLVTHSNASAIAGTLPQAGSGGDFTNGWFTFVQNRGVGTLTITPTTSTIDGAATLVLTTGQGVLIASDGTNYFTSRGIGGSGSGGTKTYGVFTPMTSQPPASNFATLDTRNSIAVLEFDAATEETVFWVGIIPEAASLGSGLIVKIHWLGDTATTGDVKWGAAFERMTTDLDADSFDTETTGTSTTSGTTGIETVTSITCTTIDSLTAGDGYRLKIARKAADGADTMSGDAQIFAVEVRSAA